MVVIVVIMIVMVVMIVGGRGLCGDIRCYCVSNDKDNGE